MRAVASSDDDNEAIRRWFGDEPMRVLHSVALATLLTMIATDAALVTVISKVDC